MKRPERMTFRNPDHEDRFKIEYEKYRKNGLGKVFGGPEIAQLFPRHVADVFDRKEVHEELLEKADLAPEVEKQIRDGLVKKWRSLMKREEINEILSSMDFLYEQSIREAMWNAGIKIFEYEPDINELEQMGYGEYVEVDSRSDQEEDEYHDKYFEAYWKNPEKWTRDDKIFEYLGSIDFEKSLALNGEWIEKMNQSTFGDTDAEYELILEVLKTHVEKVFRYTDMKEYEESVGRTLESVANELLSLTENGSLWGFDDLDEQEQEASRKHMVERIRRVKDLVVVEVVDSLESSLREISGDYHADKGLIRVAQSVVKASEIYEEDSLGVNPDAYEDDENDDLDDTWLNPSLEYLNVVRHEFLHALSGQRAYEKGDEIRFSVVGLDKQGRFPWLNEAMTEYLTQEMADNAKRKNLHSKYGAEHTGTQDVQGEMPFFEGPGSYPHAREMTRRLFGSSGDSDSLLRLLKRAYTEEETADAFKKFRKHIDVNFGANFFVTLDMFFEHLVNNTDTKHGSMSIERASESVVKKWNELEDDFPQFLAEKKYKPRKN